MGDHPDHDVVSPDLSAAFLTSSIYFHQESRLLNANIGRRRVEKKRGRKRKKKKKKN